MGWALGVERISLALGDAEEEPREGAFILAGSDGDRDSALALALELRRAGLRAEPDLAGRSVKGQMKQADRSGARHVVMLEQGRAELRDLDSGEQREVGLDGVLAALRESEAAGAAEA